MIEGCKWTDEVLYPCPWTITKDFTDGQKIDYVAHDALPYASASGEEDNYAFVKREGKFLETYRTEGISTSDLLVRIIQRQEEIKIHLLEKGFLLHSLIISGYTRQDLGISMMEEYRLRAKKMIKQSIDYVKEYLPID